MVMGYDIGQDVWPKRERGQPLAPVRVGVDATTGKIKMGWRHADQSITKLFSTRYHERILRPWVGSFVPHMLGQNTVEGTFTQFFWAFATAIDLWEPNYTIQYVRVANVEGQSVIENLNENQPNTLSSVEEIRKGHVTFHIQNVYMPRGHLGDKTPEMRRGVGLVQRGGRWENY